jgi:hypothetical protein
MNDGFAWWLVVLGIAIGVGLVWVFVVRLPRSESDVDDSELATEANWISRNIETYGGIAPQPLVEEVLELHRQYLATGPTALPSVSHVASQADEEYAAPADDPDADGAAAPQHSESATDMAEPQPADQATS